MHTHTYTRTLMHTHTGTWCVAPPPAEEGQVRASASGGAAFSIQAVPYNTLHNTAPHCNTHTLQITATLRHCNTSAATGMGWLRLVRSMKLGRAAARCTAPKLPRAIRVGPNEGDTKIGGGFIREFIQSFGPKIRGLSDFQTKFRWLISPQPFSDKPLKFE